MTHGPFSVFVSRNPILFQSIAVFPCLIVRGEKGLIKGKEGGGGEGQVNYLNFVNRGVFLDY